MEEQRTVLVVDDSDEVRDVLTVLLEDEGYKVMPVEDGEMALLMSRRLQPALITLDIGLPRLNGREILELLKADPDTASIPVLILSGQPGTSDLTSLPGPVAFLAKPFEVDEMQQLVSSLIDGSR